jgi:hypothetical protein
MNNLNIAVFGNKIFSEIISEVKLFSNFKIKYYDNLSLLKQNINKQDLLIVFLNSVFNKSNYQELEQKNCPTILINDISNSNNTSSEFVEKLSLPFTILELQKKIIFLVAKYEFKMNSLINLNGYIIDKNERKIKKNNLELQLTEKEINFLILFSQNKKPLNRSFVLKKVWNYSSKSETHTVETHIHRLRKKILNQFNDNNFIKNNKKGYYI